MKSVNPEDPVRPQSDSTVQRIDVICDAFESAWKAGDMPRIEDFLTGTEDRSSLLQELLALDLEYRCRTQDAPPDV
jgi:hypothetical protein